MNNKDNFTDNERVIIKTFYENLNKISGNDILELIWDNCNLKAYFVTDYNDYNEKLDEFYQTFIFKCVSFSGISPFDNYLPKENDEFGLCYKDFPKTILLNNEKIN